MKTITVILLLMLAQVSFSQNSDWIFRNPNPQNDFYGIKFFDQNTGYVVGSNGVILKNTTGSNSWTNIPSGTTNNLYGLYFFDVNHGYVVGQGELVMYTSNGGNSWISFLVPNGMAFRSVSFLNSNTGFVAGDNGSLYKTTTGITGLAPINVTTVNLHSVFAFDSLRAYACGDSGKFLRTTDGGSNWTVQTLNPNNLLSMFFINAFTGYVTVNLSSPLKTTDGGNTWNAFSLSGYNQIYSIKFINANTGFVVGTYGPISKSTNGGVNWSPWCSGQLFTGNTFTDIWPLDSSHAYSCGSRGLILKSIDTGYSGTSFHLGGSRYPLSSISFINENTGEVIGNYQYLYTTNGGMNWTINLVGYSSWFEGESYITDARLFGPNSGYRTFYTPGHAGYPYISLQNSTDGGLTWNGNRSYGSMGFGFGGYCETEGVTYLVNTTRQIMKNTGSGWTTLLTSNYNLGAVSFANANTGAVVGGGSVQGILRTTNGGLNWDFISSGNLHNIYDIQMLPSGVGYLAGDSTFIMKTYDYGANWSTISSGGNQFISDISFATDNVGWFLGQSRPGYLNRLFYTPNGGTNFMQLQSLMNFNVNGFSFVDALTGYVCGDSGVVLKTTNGGLTFVNTTSSNIPDKYILQQNYPNPFNPTTIIKFDIPAVGQRHTFGTKLIIYDVLGREVATLVNQQMQPGSYSVDWDGTNYPSGVYFYRLETGDYTQTKKMLMIK